MYIILSWLKVDLARLILLWLIALCLLLGGCNNTAKTEAPSFETEGGQMVSLKIDLQEGFVNDTVVLRVNDQEAFRKEGVNTQLLLGLADSFETEVEKGPVKVEVDIQTKDTAKTIQLDAVADIFLGISVVNGMIEYIASDQPFGYG